MQAAAYRNLLTKDKLCALTEIADLGRVKFEKRLHPGVDYQLGDAAHSNASGKRLRTHRSATPDFNSFVIFLPLGSK